ncbi:unnamed protein product [marine sediment metagenome]|uniref:Lin1244/Lin1753-like N-terminal domain-containing protein n=1 Tax=marine sediment metagenome TaxID=412755 RepID=X0ZXD5_9ZZZZ
MYYLRNKFKNDGYTVWFMLLENLGKAEYHYLDLKEETQLMYLSSEFMITENLLIEIIEALVKLGEFDKDLWQNESILFNEKYIDSISDAYKKRNNDCINKKSLLLLLSSKGRFNKTKSIPKPSKSTLNGDGKPQRRVKDTKVNNILEKREKKFKEKLDKFSEKYPAKILIEFFEYWSEPNKSKTKLKFEMQPTWDLSRRLSRWANSGFNFKKVDGKATYSKKNLPDNYWEPGIK